MTDKSDDRVKYFKYGAWLTGVYFGLAATAIAITPLLSGTHLGDWFEQIDLNIIGDFFSGLFAPVAFLWLVVTVLIQGKELALTRQEMADNRVVMTEQAEAAKAHKDFVKQQTKIMRRQATIAELQAKNALEAHQKNLQLSLFDKRIQIYEGFREFVGRPSFVLKDSNSFFDFVHLQNNAIFVFSNDKKMLNWIAESKLILLEAQSKKSDGETDEAIRKFYEKMSPMNFIFFFEKHLMIGG